MRCAYCGTPMRQSGARNNRRQNYPTSQTLDHVVPRCRFNSAVYGFAVGDPINRAYVCFACNNRKGDMWPLDWLRVMPAFGVLKFKLRLERMGCPAADTAQAVADRKPVVTSPEKSLTSGT